MLAEQHQQSEEAKQKRRRPVFVSRACTNCRKAHTKCDEQKPCSRCTRLGIADTCQVAEIQKRGRKRKTESSSKTTAKKTKSSSDEPVHANTPATQALQNFEHMPFDLNVLLNNEDDVEPFIIDELIDMSSKQDHSGKVYTEPRLNSGYTVYDENYVNFLLSAEMGGTCPTSPLVQGTLLNNVPPQVVHQECSKHHVAAAAFHQQVAMQYEMTGPSHMPYMTQPLVPQQIIPQQQQQQPVLGMDIFAQPSTSPQHFNISPTQSLFQPIPPVHTSTEDGAEDLREKIKQLQLENSMLKSSLHGYQALPSALSEEQKRNQHKFVTQNLRFNENEDRVGLLVSSRNGNIISMNDFMREKLGYSKEDMQMYVTNWQQLFDTKFWPNACAWAEKNIQGLEENAVLSNCVFRKKGAHNPPLESDLVRPKAFTTKFCYDCTSRSLLFSITKVYFD